jgi:predicted amidohydrolase
VLQFRRAGHFKRNLERAEGYLEVARNPDFVLLGGEFALNEPKQVDPCPPLASLAQRYECNIIAPVNANTRRCSRPTEKGHSSMHFFGRSGEVVGIQDKISFYPKERGFFKRGRKVQLFEVEGVRIALMRGLDILDHGYSNKIREADIVFFSTMAIDDMMFELARARALDIKAYFAMSSYIGRYSGMDFIGNAAIIEPVYMVIDGEHMLHQSQVLRHIGDEGLVQAELDVDHVRTMKARFAKKRSRSRA